MTTKIFQTGTFPVHPHCLPEVRAFLQEGLERANLTPERRDRLFQSLTETVDSCIQYSTFKGYENEFTLTLDIDDVRFRAVLVDSLNVFELGEELTLPDLAKERSHEIKTDLLRQVMHEIHYTYKKGCQNELELVNFN